jgi:hypothetical protein
VVNGPFTGSKERRSFKPKVASSILVGRIPFHDMIEPELRGDPTAFPDLTLAEFVPIFLERHEATGVRPRTISTLDVRMGNPGTRYGEFQTALITGSFSLALTVAKDLPRLTLADALRLTLLASTAKPERYKAMVGPSDRRTAAGPALVGSESDIVMILT